MTKKKRIWLFVCGLLGCLCFGGGDWLMLYGDPSYTGTLSWLTEGTANIAPWRYTLAMALSFPGILLYGAALFSMEQDIPDARQRKAYHYLNAFGLTPWLCLHLFYILILYAFSWMRTAGYGEAAHAVCEAVFSHFSWVVIASEAMMLPVFLYWFVLQIKGHTVYPKWMAFTNVLFIYLLLKGATLLMPANAFRIGFTNGLMSESMAIWFLLHLWQTTKRKEKEYVTGL